MTAPRVLNGLASGFHGRLITPGDRGFDDSRRVWNGAINQRPALIAECRSVGDVRAVVTYAGERGLAVAVRGGGHSVNGYGVPAGGIVVDLTSMRLVRVDPSTCRADVSGGALWADVDRASGTHGLATTGAIISGTGAAGTTLGGGIGHLVRRFGLSADQLVDAALVDASGAVRTVDVREDPELLWGLRGGGGNFGVVTRVGLRLHPVGHTVVGGVLLLGLDDPARSLLRYRDLCQEAPRTLGSIAIMRRCPPDPSLPARRHGSTVLALVLSWTGRPDVAEEVLRPYRALGEVMADSVRPLPYAELQRSLDARTPPGNHYHWRSAEVADLGESVVDVIVEAASRIPNTVSSMPIYHLGGAVDDVGPTATAFGTREARHHVEVFAGWEPSEPREGPVEWAELAGASLAPHRLRPNLNFLSRETPEQIEAAYGDSLPRLTALKRRLDPDNMFRFNANVDPGRTQ